MRLCDVVGCGREWYCRTWCRAHYSRWYRTGDVSAATPIGVEQSAVPGQHADYYWRTFMAGVRCFTHPLAAHIKTHEHFHRDQRRDQRDHEAGWRYANGSWQLLNHEEQAA